jgi:hypothetical protein
MHVSSAERSPDFAKSESGIFRVRMSYICKIRGLTLICALTLSLVSVCQNETRIWYFGNGSGLNFSTSPPTVLNNGAISTSVGCAAICNATGALLFYTDGVTIWTSSHTVMANGTGLSGTPGAQTSVIVKRPASTSLYYVFTVEGGGGSSGLSYSIVDMSLSSGSGSVTVKNAPLYVGPCEEKISATRHCNQTDAWVIVRPMSTNSFVTFPLTSAGVGTMVVSSYSAQLTHTLSSPRGNLKFSPNGRRLAEVFTHSNSTPSLAALGVNTAYQEAYEFDNNTGTVLGVFYGIGYMSSGNGWGYGTEWSPDGTKLYYTFWGGVYQLNCGSSGTWLTPIGDYVPSSQWRATMQLGPDGKIYVANPGLNTLGVIHAPNNAANSCSYQASAIPLGTVCQYGLPNFYTSYFENPTVLITGTILPGQNCRTYGFSSPGICPTYTNPLWLGNPFSGYVPSLHQWNFGDPASGAANTSTAASPVHNFSSPGTYTVKLLLTYQCGTTDSAFHVINALPTPTITVLTPSVLCGVTSASATVAGNSGALSYSWSSGLGTGSFVTGLVPGIHTVAVTDAANGCTISTTFNTLTLNITGSMAVKPTCSGLSNGSATITVSGGSGTYSYSWTAASVNNSVTTGLAIGAYTVYVTDIINICNLTNTFTVQQSPAMQVNATSSALGPVCTGNSAVLTGSMTGGTPPYTASWIGFSPGNTLQISSSVAGNTTYSFSVFDFGSCNSTATINVQFIQTPTLSINGSTICIGKTATLSVSGAQVAHWFPGAIPAFTHAVSPQATTIYTVIGSNGMCATTATTQVTVLPLPKLIAAANTPLCQGQQLSLSASGALSYQWNGPGGFTSGSQNPVITNVQPSASGVYVVSGTDKNACTSSMTIQVVVLPAPVISPFSNSPLCQGNVLQLTGNGGVSYLWSGPIGFGSSAQSPSLSPVQASNAGIYSVTVTGSNSCKATGTVNVIVNSSPLVTLSGPSQLCLGQSAVLTASGGATYSWNPGSQQPTVMVSPFNGMTYSVAAKDANGCSGTASIYVGVSECLAVADLITGSFFRFYPNPHSSVITVECEAELFLTITDIGSRVIASWRASSGVSEFSPQLSPGIYFLTVTGERYFGVHKLIREN